MKKSIHFFSALLLAASLAACTAQPAENTVDDETAIDVVTNSYAAYDWVKQIFADDTDHIRMTYLLENGVDLQSAGRRRYPEDCGLRCVHLCGRRVGPLGT